MCTALPPSRNPLTTNTAATVHNRLWPTVRVWPAAGRSREVFRLLSRRRCPASGTTLPCGVFSSRVFVRGGVALPRPRFALRRLDRSTLPRLPPFLSCPIVRPILRFASVDFQGAATGLLHAELPGTLPNIRGARQFRDPDLEPLPFFSGPVELHSYFGRPRVESRGDRVQIDAPQHQEHGYNHEHRKLAAPTGGLPAQRAVRRAIRGALLEGPRWFRRERGPVPALRRGHQLPFPGGSAVLSAARSLAEALRGFSSTSRPEGLRTSPRLKMGRAPQTHTGSSGGQTHRPSRWEMKRLTRRSSPEWNVTATSRPPDVRSRSAASSALARLPNSSFTLTRTAWKTLLAGLPPLSFQPTAARTASYRSVVIRSGLLLMISRATRLASPRGTSPYSESTLASSPTSTVLRYSAAETPEPGSIRMSSGPSST